MLLDAHGRPIGDTLDEDEIVARMLVELEACIVPMELVLQPFTVLQLAGLLQLALRHPKVSEPHQETAGRFLEVVREYFADSPTVLQTLDRGDDPTQDVVTSGPSIPSPE